MSLQNSGLTIASGNHQQGISEHRKTLDRTRPVTAAAQRQPAKHAYHEW